MLCDMILQEPTISEYADALRKIGMLDGELDVEEKDVKYTVIAPNNAALQDSALFQLYSLGASDSNEMQWMGHFAVMVRNHIIPDVIITDNEMFTAMEILTTIDGNNLTVNTFLKRIENSAIVIKDIGVAEGFTNRILHIVDSIAIHAF